MKHRLGWVLIFVGVLIDSAVIFLPLTPYPVIQMIFDRDYYDAHKGYETFLESGKWEEGDRGFPLVQRKYMQDVVKGLRPELPAESMPGASLVTFQLALDDATGTPLNERKVYVVYSTQTGDVVDGRTIQSLLWTFRKPYSNLVGTAMLMVGTVLVYSGLTRIAGPRATEATGAGGTALSRDGAS